jgi:hypothetical protein
MLPARIFAVAPAINSSTSLFAADGGLDGSGPVAAEKGPIMQERTTDLRTMLRRDFGVDLQIAGGSGGSATDPIVITCADPVDAAATEMLARISQRGPVLEALVRSAER